MKVFSSMAIAMTMLGTDALGYVPCNSGRRSKQNTRPSRLPTHRLSMGLLDDLKLIFSEEGKKNREAYDERERKEMMEAQKEILERRKNPDKMRAYEDEVGKRRQKLSEEKSVYDFQQKSEEGYDPLTDWTKLKEEGKIKIGKDLERDEGSRRLGSDGLIDVRVDERMPYIDQGYVDESADVVGNIMNLFGGKKGKKGDKKE